MAAPPCAAHIRQIDRSAEVRTASALEQCDATNGVPQPIRATRCTSMRSQSRRATGFFAAGCACGSPGAASGCKARPWKAVCGEGCCAARCAARCAPCAPSAASSRANGQHSLPPGLVTLFLSCRCFECRPCAEPVVMEVAVAVVSELLGDPNIDVGRRAGPSSSLGVRLCIVEDADIVSDNASGANSSRAPRPLLLPENSAMRRHGTTCGRSLAAVGAPAARRADGSEDAERIDKAPCDAISEAVCRVDAGAPKASPVFFMLPVGLNVGRCRHGMPQDAFARRPIDSPSPESRCACGPRLGLLSQ